MNLNLYEYDPEKLEYKKVSLKLLLLPFFICIFAVSINSRLFTIETYSPAQNKVIKEKANFAEWTRYKMEQKTYDIQEKKFQNR